MFTLPRAALASALLLAACEPAANPTPAPTADAPWNRAGPAERLLNAQGLPREDYHGVWRSRGYGWILDIDEDGVTRYQEGASCYATPSETRDMSAMA